MTLVGRPRGTTRVASPAGSVAVELVWGVATDVGRRRAGNEDSAVAVPPLFAVADGMGGHSAGDLASAAAVQHLARAARGDFLGPEEIGAALRAAAEDINQLADGLRSGAGTTVTGAALTLAAGQPAFLVFNVGDSRVYRFHGTELSQVTVDHSVVQELVDAGEISAEEAEYHPESNVITRALGFHEAPRPDFTVVPLEPGLRLVLCSDGLTREVEDSHLRMHLAAGLSAETTADALVDAALASGGRDNVTVAVIDVQPLSAPPVRGSLPGAPRSGASTV